MVRYKLLFVVVELCKLLAIMFEDMVRINIPKIIVNHLHGSMFDLLLVVKALELVGPVTICYVTCI